MKFCNFNKPEPDNSFEAMAKVLSLITLLFLFITCTRNSRPLSLEELLIQKIDSLNKAGYQITDYHSHLKGGLTMEQLLAHSEKTGIRYGVAVNGGLGFPVASDSALSLYYHQNKHYPVFHALQAEGREWVNIFSPDSVRLFDYVFTDAMTFTDASGNRNRLWIKNETFVSDPQEFMDYLVIQIETILSTEKIDIYVNPTYLPDTLAPRYEELWTTERMERVVNALKNNNIAMEINSRLKLPSPAFIKLAKSKGVKFTMGTNNTDAELGYLEYGLNMITECGLTPEDFWRCR